MHCFYPERRTIFRPINCPSTSRACLEAGNWQINNNSLSKLAAELDWRNFWCSTLNNWTLFKLWINKSHLLACNQTNPGIRKSLTVLGETARRVLRENVDFACIFHFLASVDFWLSQSQDKIIVMECYRSSTLPSTRRTSTGFTGSLPPIMLICFHRIINAPKQ